MCFWSKNHSMICTTFLLLVIATSLVESASTMVRCHHCTGFSCEDPNFKSNYYTGYCLTEGVCFKKKVLNAAYDMVTRGCTTEPTSSIGVCTRDEYNIFGTTIMCYCAGSSCNHGGTIHAMTSRRLTGAIVAVLSVVWWRRE